MKKLLLLLIFVLFNLTVFGQTAEIKKVSFGSGIEDIYLAKDDGKGKNGDIAGRFATTDIPIHCVVMLATDKAVTVKMTFVAVNVKGVKPESKVVTTVYKTDGTQNIVNFTGKPDGVWTAGSYRVDIFLDGVAAGNLPFEIEKSAEIENTPAVKKFVPSKNFISKPKPRRIAKNQ